MTTLLVLRESEPRARIAHRCDGCSDPIQPGRMYLRRVSIEGGKFQSSALHRMGCGDVYDPEPMHYQFGTILGDPPRRASWED